MDRFVRALEDRAVPIAADIHQAIRNRRTEAAGFGVVAGDPGLLAEAMGALAPMLLECLRRGRGLSDDQRRVAIELAAELASEAFTLTDVSFAAHATIEVMLRHAFEAWPALSDHGDVTDLSDIVHLLHGLGHELSGCMNEGFRDVREDTGRLRDSFLRSLLERPFDVSMATRARALRISLSPPLGLVALVDPSPRVDTEFPDRLAACVRSFPLPCYGPVPYDARPEHPDFGVIIVPAWRADVARSNFEGFAGEVKRHGCVAVVAQAASETALDSAFRELLAAVEIAAFSSGHLGAVFDVRAALPSLVVNGLDPATAIRVLRDYLGGLMQRSNKKMALDHVETLEDFYAEGSVSPAAERLLLHNQSVRERLRRIGQLTGRDVVREQFGFQIAIALFRLHQDEWAPPGDQWWDSREL